MRLIDADALMEQKPFTSFVGHMSHWGKAYNECAEKAREAVRQAPTVDAIVLPCKVGDTVWILGDKFPAEIEEIKITNDGIFFVYVEYDRGYELTEVWDDGKFQAADIGKSVFLTPEEAGAALAKMGVISMDRLQKKKLDTAFEKIGDAVRAAAKQLDIFAGEALKTATEIMEHENALAAAGNYDIVWALRPVARELSELTGDRYIDYLDQAREMLLQGKDRADVLYHFDMMLYDMKQGKK